LKQASPRGVSWYSSSIELFISIVPYVVLRTLEQFAPLQKGETRRCNPNDTTTIRFLPHDKSPIIRIFPNRKPGAGRAPSIHHFFVAPFAVSHPLEEIEDQGFYNRVNHLDFPPEMSHRNRLSAIIQFPLGDCFALWPTNQGL
jgi:hypothetical protein